MDGRKIEAAPGMTVLQAARAAGIEIPTLCYVDGIEPRTSCFLCVVKAESHEHLQPACVMPVAEDMVVWTRSPEVMAARRTALELLFSDHAGRCAAPCAMACPAHLDIPGFIRRLRAGRLRDAAAIVRQQLVFPAVLGRICPATCENPCFRKEVDEAVSIRLLHRHVADADLASGHPWLPALKPASGKKVAIAGAGPAGLAAAWYLAQEGHACDLLDAAERPGGLLWRIPDDLLDKSVLAAEIEVVLGIGARFEGGWRLGRDGSIEDLSRRYDAVLIAIGASVDAPSPGRRPDLDLAAAQGIRAGAKGIEAHRDTLATNLAGVFAAGEAVSGPATLVRTVAAARRAVAAIHQRLRGESVTGEPKPFYFASRGNGHEDHLKAILVLNGLKEDAPKTRRAEAGPKGLGESGARHEAARCLQCGCLKEHTCRLRAFAAEHGINPYRFQGEGRSLEPDVSHAEVIYEPGKCILCGLCLWVAEAAGEERGLSFAGRGFPTRVVAPLGSSLPEGLRKAARQCAEVCPTAAFSVRE
jgi:NADPH-dependent 2,4-dienoyl-CoA reductase/sulfur reductase-like enzyme